MSPSRASCTSMRLDLLDDDRREPFGRLVHDQEVRVAEQRAANREHLLLAAGQLRAAAGPPLVKAREGLVDALYRPRRIRPAGGDEAQMLVDREARPDAPSLRHIADAEAMDNVRLEPRWSRDRECGCCPTAPTSGPQWCCTACSCPCRFDRPRQARRGRLSSIRPEWRGSRRNRPEGPRSSAPAIAGLSHDDLRDTLPAPADRLRFPAGVPSLNIRPLCSIETYSVTRSATSRSCSIIM